MKIRISTIIIAVSMLASASSCTKKDNFKEPDVSFEGNLIQEGTKINVQTCTGNVNIRLEQLSWSETPTPQDIPVKIDGSFKNTKLFQGHYRVSVKGGAFWAIPPVEMDINNGTKYDFQLTPYLLITHLRHEMIGDSLKLNFDLEAPIDGGMPTIIDVQPYVNTTKLVGPGASIYDFSDTYKLPALNKDWASFTTAEKSPEIIIPDLIRGRTFFVRVGVKFNDNDKNSNLSEVIQITVPK